jgi:hypothetical protein
MKIVFRCKNCETINNIPAEYMFRFCKNCGKIVTYAVGEAIIHENNELVSEKFLNAQKLSTKLAEQFFILAEEEEDMISRIIFEHENKEIEIPDLPAASVSDTIILVLRSSRFSSLDEIIRNCSFFNITKSQVEKILLQLRKEGILYQPKSWIIKLA